MGRRGRGPVRRGGRRGKPQRRRPAPRAPRERGAEPAAPRADWIGILERRGRRARVTPYRDDAIWSIAVSRGDLADAEDGDVVVVAPVAPRKGRGRLRPVPSRGRVVEVLGRPGDAEADFRAVVWRRRLPVAFPAEVLAQTEALRPELGRDELERRVDLRDRPFVTIDPATARDHDDAVCVEPGGDGGARLWVAIADVSYFVPEHSPIDREALRRGNSVYFPDRAIPMLPERLSSDLGSLRPDIDRPALAVELSIDRKGRVRRRSFFPAVIRSRARLVYEEAARTMEGKGGAPGREVGATLGRLRDVARALQRRRFARGSMDFDLPAVEIVLGDDRRPVDLVEAPRTVAHRAIEEAMLAANRAVAEALVASGTPTVFRNHEAPPEQSLEELAELFAAFGLFEGAPAELLDPRRLASVLSRVEGRPEERLVNQVVLRSMRQARYEAQSRGHFALAFEHYTHFTSPIRRYADLVVHRALRDLLESRRRAVRLAPVAERLSRLERVAMEAEREMVDLKQCAFMAERVGLEYDGAITGVARHGLYVTLDELFVTGLVHVSRLPGYFEFDERAHALVASRSGRRFRLGDRLRVLVVSVNPIKAHIDFEIVSGRRRRTSQSASSS